MKQTVLLDPGLYRPGAVRESAREFAGLARITVVRENDRLAVSFEEIDPEVETVLVDEFLNFSLAATVAARG